VKSAAKEPWPSAKKPREFTNTTGQAEGLPRKSGIKEGLCLVNAMHITASVFANDDEPGLHRDFDAWLEKLAPREPVSSHRHNAGETNADAHLKRQIMGREAVVAVTQGNQFSLAPLRHLGCKKALQGLFP